MLTRCPKCNTAFRVTSEQLKARQGRVRCGECQEVFNALDTLIETVPPPAAAPDAVAAQPAQAVPSAASVHAGEEPPLVAPSPIEPESADVEVAAPSAPVALPEPEAIAPLPESAEPQPIAEPGLEPLLHEDEEPARRAWPWAIGIATALFALAAQATVIFRTELAILYPGTKPALVAACDMLGCELSLPRKPDLVGIEASDLHPDSGGRLTLTATLKNRAPFVQEYPYLELSLTDTNDQPLVRRALAPAEYLLPDTSVPAGFKANSDLAISLAVEAPGIPAVGYRLYLFYP